MNIKTFAVVAITSIASFFAFADQGDVLITFSTPGPDKYADGTVVKDGEWYALCWAKDGQFDGLSTACKAVAENEELILAAPLAKNGKCPFVAFEFPQTNKYDNGKFSVLLLDTRNASGKVAARGANGLPAFVNTASVAATTEKGSAMAAEASAAVAVCASAKDLTTLVEGTNLEPVTISAIQVVGANVQLTVSSFDPTASYVVKTGASIDKLEGFPLNAPAKSSDKTATFIIPKEKGSFFSVGSVK